MNLSTVRRSRVATIRSQSPAWRPYTRNATASALTSTSVNGTTTQAPLEASTPAISSENSASVPNQPASWRGVSAQFRLSTH